MRRNKSKRRKSFSKSRKYHTRRYKGGQPSVSNIMQQVHAEREPQSEPHILGDTLNLTKGLVSNVVNNIGAAVGINLSNPREINQSLDQINAAMTNPETKAKVKAILANAAQTGREILEAASPFLQPLIAKIISETEQAAGKIGESMVKVGLNTAEEIPGVGILIGTVRSLSNIGEAIASSTNAGAEIITALSDTANATAKNWEQLQAKKREIMERTQSSMNKFTAPVRNPRSEPPFGIIA